MDPIYVALGGVISTLATLFWRELVKRAERAERDADFWRDKALEGTALAEIATDVAERRKR